jgi:hypothetical protein
MATFAVDPEMIVRPGSYRLRGGAKAKVTGQRVFRFRGFKLVALVGYILPGFERCTWHTDGRYSPADNQPPHELDIISHAKRNPRAETRG